MCSQKRKSQKGWLKRTACTRNMSHTSVDVLTHADSKVGSCCSPVNTARSPVTLYSQAAEQARYSTEEQYERDYRRSISDPVGFWYVLFMVGWAPSHWGATTPSTHQVERGGQVSLAHSLAGPILPVEL